MIVIALGGNALLRSGEPRDVAHQRANVRAAAEALGPVLRANDVVLTHGNGPQVGELDRLARAGGQGATPLDVLDAESEGLIGYLLVQELHNVLRDRPLACLLTQVVVDAADPAFTRPEKPIGDHVDPRLVASPLPRGVVELPAIRALLAAHIIPVAVGGGGIPVVEAADGTRRGIDAVVDKDRSAALLASALDATHLVLLTDVDGVYLDWGTDSARRVSAAHPEALAAYAFAPGSMGPKVAAAVEFARQGGTAVIGALDDAARVATGSAGTTVTLTADGITTAA
ncbi:MAG: carbamate kinase [Actinomycetota bacterium]